MKPAKKTCWIFLLIAVACSPKSKFEDTATRKIYDLKDRRKTDSLLYYLRSEDPIHRREAALAFGSVQDTTASPSLGSALLEDPDIEVRISAAFALGQTGGIQAVNALIPALEDRERAVVREVLEALGKSAGKLDVHHLTEFQSPDTLLKEGQAWGLYQLGTRRMADSLVTVAATRLLDLQNSRQTLLASAHYFGRSATVHRTGFEEGIRQLVLQSRDSEIRMAAVSGMKHFDASAALPLINSIMQEERDYRIRANAVRVCQNFVDSAMAKTIILGALSDSSEMVQVAASEIVRRFGEKFASEQLAESLLAATCIRARANLYAVVLKSEKELPVEVSEVLSSSNLYGKAHFLSALGEARAPLNRIVFELLKEELLNNANEKVILTTSASALVAINRSAGKELLNTEFLDVYKQAIAGGDAGVIGIVCAALRDENLHYKEMIGDLAFLHDAKSKLKLPKDIESIVPLDRAIAYFEGKEFQPPKNEFNHPIDWKFVGTIPKDQRAEIKTSKGTIVVRLLVEEAPGSVANFVELANKKYFDGKHVHRVVPNFVVQDGCNRGDGYGSEDYSIRSEFSRRRYITGSVGMASAGKDTEGTQWFITHSPTPHLDGKYTIFAEVESGMDVVHKLDVGDEILEIKILNK